MKYIRIVLLTMLYKSNGFFYSRSFSFRTIKNAFMPFSCLTFLLQISGLNSGRGLKITIYAANANGRSPNVILEGFTLKVAELQVGK